MAIKALKLYNCTAVHSTKPLSSQHLLGGAGVGDRQHLLL